MSLSALSKQTPPPLRGTPSNLEGEWSDGTGNVFVTREEIGASEGWGAHRPTNCTKQATPAPPDLLLGGAAERNFDHPSRPPLS